jgi:hypothetical protein
MAVYHYAEGRYAECLMLNVTYKPFRLCVFMLSVVMLSVAAPFSR